MKRDMSDARDMRDDLSGEEVFSLLKKEVLKIDADITDKQVKGFLADNRYYLFSTSIKREIVDPEFVADMIKDIY